MANYGNSQGRNKGKKYFKATGNEIVTPENEARARAFMDWYGANYEVLRKKHIYANLYDAEIATDAAIYIYDDICIKGLEIRNYLFYYLRAYYTKRLRGKIETLKETARVKYIDEYGEDIAAPENDALRYERIVDQLKEEILDHVRINYDQESVSIFEIYIALQPDTSYKRLARMLGYPPAKVWPIIGAIRKDIAENFAARKAYLLSII